MLVCGDVVILENRFQTHSEASQCIPQGAFGHTHSARSIIPSIMHNAKLVLPLMLSVGLAFSLLLLTTNGINGNVSVLFRWFIHTLFHNRTIHWNYWSRSERSRQPPKQVIFHFGHLICRDNMCGLPYLTCTIFNLFLLVWSSTNKYWSSHMVLQRIDRFR